MKGMSYDTSRTLLNGVGASVKMGKWSKGHWRYDAGFILRSPGLDLNDMGYMNLSNILKNNNTLSYVEKKNYWIFKTYLFTLLNQNAWDAHGDGLYSLTSLTAQSEFMNGWIAQLAGQYKFRTTDEWLLRGGPAMKVPDVMAYTWSVQSNSSKKLILTLTGNYNKGVSGNLNYISAAADISFRPRSNLLLSLQPNYQRNADELQYISEVNKTNSAKSYLLGRVDNRNLGFAFRIDYAITPELTIQYYGSPFVSIGKYRNFKEVTKPLDPIYNNRFALLTPQKNGSVYSFDDNHDNAVDFTINNPDFNYQQFRSNFVIRWEYKVGSSVYLVWSQNRTNFEQPGVFNFNKGFNNIFDLYPKNIFMIKFNYLFRY
jgi:hypothetical protein